MYLNYGKYKWIGLSIVGIFLLIGLIEIIFQPHSPQYANVPTSSVTQPSQAPITNQQTQAMETSIKSILDSAYSQASPKNDMMNTTSPYPSNTVRAVSVSVQPSGGYDVHIDINSVPDLAGDVYYDASIAYVALYKNNTMGISNISVSEHYPRQDQYGNPADVVGVTTSLDENVASKINWNSPQLQDILLHNLNCTGVNVCGGLAPGPAIE